MLIISCAPPPPIWKFLEPQLTQKIFLWYIRKTIQDTAYRTYLFSLPQNRMFLVYFQITDIITCRLVAYQIPSVIKLSASKIELSPSNTSSGVDQNQRNNVLGLTSFDCDNRWDKITYNGDTGSNKMLIFIRIARFEDVRLEY